MRKSIFNTYEVDSDGYVINIKRNKIVKPYYNVKTGFNKLTLIHNGKAVCFGLHQLVAMCFTDYNADTDTITFKNGDKKDCNVSNLEINKLARIKSQSQTDEINDFFIKNEPYKIVNAFIKIKYSYFDYYLSFIDIEDLRQFFITHIHRKTHIYLLKYQDKSYFTWAFNLINNLIKFKSRCWTDFILANVRIIHTENELLYIPIVSNNGVLSYE